MNRLRRIVNRLLGWLIGTVASLLAILLLVLAVYVLFFDYPAHIKGWMEAEASRIMNRQVRIEKFSVNLPNSFELQGVSALPGEPGPPWLEFESLRGKLNLVGILHREIQLSLLQVDGLTVRVQDYGGGQVDLPGFWGPPVSRPPVAAGASFAFLADRVRFEDASFVYSNHNLPWRLEATNLIAQLDREGLHGYRGRLSYEEGEVQIKDRPSFECAVDAQLELVGKDLRLVDFQAKGPFYTVRAEGDVSLGGEPHAQFSLEAQSRVSPAAHSLLGLPQLEDAGSIPATFMGELSMGRGWHQIRGQIEVPAARFIDMPLRNWKGEIYWDRSILEISSARGALAGGTSELQIRQPLPVAEHPARVEVELRKVPLQDLVLAVSGEAGPLASNVSGTVRLDVPSNAYSELSGAFELSGEPPDGSEQTGVEFSTRGAIDRGGLQIDGSRFVSDIATGELSGSYFWADSTDLHLDVTLRDLARADRVQKALRTLFHREPLARLLGLGGSGRATGRVTGRFPRLVFEGYFQGEGVSFRSMNFGNVEAHGSWSAEAIHLESFEARRDVGMLRGTGELTLGLETPSDWGVEGEVHAWPAVELFELLQIPVPLDGELSAKGKFSSRDGRGEGEGAASVTSGSLYAVAFDRADAGVKLQGPQIILETLSMARQEARLEGRMVFDRETGGIGGELASRRFPLSVFAPESLDLHLEGEMEAALELGGALGQPEVILEANISAMALGDTHMGDGRLAARVEGEAATASLSIGSEALEIEAHTRTRLLPGYPTEGDLRWRGADLGPWLRLVPADLPESLGLLSDGEATFGGQIGRFDSWIAEAVMENIRLEVGDYRLTSSSPTKALLRQGIVHLGDLRLAGEDTEVTLSGELPLGEGNLDLVAKGSVNVDILEGLYPSLNSSGRVDLSARVRGNWKRPSLSGYADLSSGVLRLQEFPQALGDIRGRVSFDNRTVRFTNIQARFGGAPVTLTGTLLLRGLSPDSFELSFAGQGLRLRYPEGLVATLDADLRMSGTSQSQILSGRIDVSEATWAREYDLATGILVSRDAEGLGLLEEIEEETSLNNLRFDVAVVMPGTLRIRNSRASVDARAELQLRGTFTHPALLGRTDALRGELFLLGQRYRLVSGRVEFLDPSTVKPFFDLVAESRVRSYRVELRLTGTPDRFFPELSSEPPLRTVDILRLLAGASERDILIGSEEEEIAGVGVASLLTERLTQEVGRRAERLFGLDRFSIDPFLVGQFANPTARVSIGKQIYRDLSVSYSTNLNAATETLILIEYTPEGPISWIISRDEEGAYGVDLRFRKSF